MVTLGLELLAFQQCQVFTLIDIIEIIAFGDIEKSAGQRFLQDVFGIRCDA